jgi:hypothetical protein
LRPGVVQKAAAFARSAPGHKHDHNPHDNRGHSDCDEARHWQQKLGMGDCESNDPGDRARARGEQNQRGKRIGFAIFSDGSVN